MREKNFILYAVPFSISIVLNTMILVVPLLAIDLGANTLTLGGLGFINTLFYVFLTPLFGRLLDQIGYRYLLPLGVFVYFLSALGFSLSTKVYQFFIFMACGGIAGAMFWPSFEIVVAEMGKNKFLLKKAALFNISWSVGAGVGPFLAGVLFEIHSHLPLCIASFLSFSIFLILLRRLSEHEEKSSFGDTREVLLKENPSSRTKEVIPYYLYIGWIANFVNYFCVGIIRYLFPKLAIQLGIQPFIIGVLFSTIALSQTITFYILGKTSRWPYRSIPLISLQLFGILGLLLVFLGSSMISFFLAFMLIGAEGGIAYFSSVFYSLDNVRGRGQKSGIHEATLGGGLLLGPLVGGAIAEAYTLRSPYLFAIFIMGVALFAEALLIRKGGNASDKIKGTI